MYSETYQKVLIGLGIVATIMFGAFFYRELFPEYRIYQNDYIALEKFRSTYTGEAPPAFNEGVKQIVFEREDKGPASVDRCISCHVATELPHFSPTKLKTDADGKVVRNKEGVAETEPNENYVWARLDAKILELNLLKKESKATSGDEAQAKALGDLKVAHVGEYEYDVTKVLRMHPLIGKETRPFEFHPLEEYGCTSCHSGNGRALTTDKAHGPVFDSQYEEEFTGYHPQFTEIDKENDPRFSTVFNHKPGDSLVFQTHPILVGTLLQSRCVNCHKPVDYGVSRELDGKGSLTYLTKDYLRGRELYISQACYACHRIASFARGGVGPELTREGSNYPWFIKESIVWPQADLPTSTMPNYSLDHVELEDLMTFILAQNGRPKSTSEIDYQTNLTQWETGKKMPWEQAISPTQVRDLHYAMTIFATEGCAACHRLQGFTSNVGFAVEKEKNPTFDSLYEEKQWFKSLFPEEVHGTEIVKILEKYGDDIDRRIADNVRENSFLEDLEKHYPEILESFYSNFRFASRAKNTSYRDAKKNITPWKKRVHNVMMMYIQEYGLGRLICPRPNWSGIYRSDEWLIQHFRNPTAYTPRSIMPIFPFDDTKFYALTHMLDVLGKRNRDAVREIWEHKGFIPEEAYSLFCSQCHGTYRQGNGPVATWIYPIPKNLRNAEFMRNLTKEHAIDSIMHGVKGTPMPPWGEVHPEKENYDGIPVLTHDEVVKLVDWLYTSLPGSTIQLHQDVPKWLYTPEDVEKELKNEGSFKDLTQPPKGTLPNIHSLLRRPEWDRYYAAIDPVPLEQPSSPIFDVIRNPNPGGEKNLYYIKKQLYTSQNLIEGKRFFELNCAVCHGNDADGTGTRSAIMTDAKPRMLVNLDWIDSRDDLRLLRSIKYGVPGTAMTPWGDLTNGKQRLQLVVYIRSLSAEKERRRQLATTVYEAFESEKQELEKERAIEYVKINDLQKQYDDLAAERNEVSVGIKNGEKKEAEAVALYQKELDIQQKLIEAKSEDQKLIDAQASAQQRWTEYTALGNEFISANVSDEIWSHLLPLIAAHGGLKKDGSKQKVIEENKEFIIQALDVMIEDSEKEKAQIMNRTKSEERDQELTAINSRIEGYKKLKSELLKK